MSLAYLTTLVLVFIYITALPRIFFRGDGQFNLMWWITGLPLGLSPMAVVLHGKGLIPQSLTLPTSEGQEATSVILCILSFCMISYTLGTHRIPLALWHQENDAPKEIVTWGAYSRIRHPFYSSFITALLASLVAAPNILTLFSLVYGFLILNRTAQREEKRLSASQYGQEYIEYMKSTGRFFPKL